MTLRNRSMRAGAAVLTGAPAMVPQDEIPARATPVKIVDGFWQLLPAKSTIPVDRVYFKNFPRPLFKGGLPPYPVPVPIARLQIPAQQSYIIRSISFQVWQQSGVGVEDLTPVDPLRVASYIGFSLTIGDRGVTDFGTNVTARGQVINYDTAGTGKPGSVSSPPLPGQGTIFPFAGPLQPVGENFAVYGLSSQMILATFYIMREPEFEARMVSFRMSGFNVNESLLYNILQGVSNGQVLTSGR